MITIYLKNHTDFFQKLTEKYRKFMSVSAWEVFIGAIITRHIGQLVSNPTPKKYDETFTMKLMIFCSFNRFAMDMPFRILR